MKQLQINDVNVSFPFEPYACQMDYMSKVIEALQKGLNAMLESPTGTGKTACLLCASLAWLEQRKAQTQLKTQVGLEAMLGAGGEGNELALKDDTFAKLAQSVANSTGKTWGGAEFAVPKVIYASRTHSQLSQAVGELKRTAYCGMKASVIGSREQMCIHEQVKREQSNTSKVHLCRSKVNARSCHYYNNLDALKRNGDVRQSVAAVTDIEDLVAFGEKFKVCPYYMSRELKADADIIFMPYNYLLDPKTRKAHGVELQGNILIFDEAHNLEKICEESASFDLSSTDLATGIEEISRLAEKLVSLSEQDFQSVELSTDITPEPEFTLDDVLRLKGTLSDLERAVDELPIKKDGTGITKNGMYMFELLATVNVTYETKNMLLDVLDKIIAYLSNDGSAYALNTKGAGLSTFADVLKVVFSREPGDGRFSVHELKQMLSKSYKVHIQAQEKPKNKKTMDLWTSASSKSDKQGRVLSYWCFSAGHSMKELVAGDVKSIILTSGTLSPMSSFSTEMQIPFPIQLENSHVIDKHQVWIGTLGKGPDQYLLNSSFQHRSDPHYQASLGKTIVNFARLIPDGMLVFFPSYPVMDQCIEYWRSCEIWDNMCRYKPVLIEPKGKTAFHDAMDEFYKQVNDPSERGALFMAVCRGKVSEGLDFADMNGRAVLITGLPFPPRMDAKVILKMQFLDECKRTDPKGLSGNDWYRQQASRAVNQAVGRVIRHKDDYGAILLCDNRFGGQSSLSQLPVWLRSSVKANIEFGQVVASMRTFFKHAQQTMPAPVPRKAKSVQSGSGGYLGSHGASFFPTISSQRSVTNASVVMNHVPSLKSNSDDGGVSESRLTTEYAESQTACNQGKTTNYGSNKRSLLEALASDEDSSISADINYNKAVTCNTELDKRMAAERMKLINRKKVQVKRTPSLTNAAGDSASPALAPSVTSVHQQTAESYLTQVKNILSAESYKIFSQTLLSYKKTGEFITMVTVLADLFTDNPLHYTFFRAFYRFVRPVHKEEFHRLCCEITGEGCGYKPEHAVIRKSVSGANKNMTGATKIEQSGAINDMTGVARMEQSAAINNTTGMGRMEKASHVIEVPQKRHKSATAGPLTKMTDNQIVCKENIPSNGGPLSGKCDSAVKR